jgi:hypothetical protein
MAAEVKKEIALEIAHVLLIDILTIDNLSLSPAFARGLVARAQGDGIAANAAFYEAHATGTIGSRAA